MSGKEAAMQALEAQRTRHAVKWALRPQTQTRTGYLRELVAPHGDHHVAEQVEGAGVDGDIHQTELSTEEIAGKRVLPSVHIAYAESQVDKLYCEPPPSPWCTPRPARDSHEHPSSGASECGSSTRQKWEKRRHAEGEEWCTPSSSRRSHYRWRPSPSPKSLPRQSRTRIPLFSTKRAE